MRRINYKAVTVKTVRGYLNYLINLKASVKMEILL